MIIVLVCLCVSIALTVIGLVLFHACQTKEKEKEIWDKAWRTGYPMPKDKKVKITEGQLTEYLVELDREMKRSS